MMAKIDAFLSENSLQARITRIVEKKDANLSLWALDGYLAALLEWGVINICTYDKLRGLFPKKQVVKEIGELFLGMPNRPDREEQDDSFLLYGKENSWQERLEKCPDEIDVDELKCRELVHLIMKERQRKGSVVIDFEGSTNLTRGVVDRAIARAFSADSYLGGKTHEITINFFNESISKKEEEVEKKLIRHEDLSGRIKDQLTWGRSADTVALIWHGYLIGLFEWGLIDVQSFRKSIVLLPIVGYKELAEISLDRFLTDEEIECLPSSDKFRTSLKETVQPITVEKAYRAMFYFLNKKYGASSSKDIEKLLHSLSWENWKDGGPEDPEIWDEWVDAIREAFCPIQSPNKSE